MDNISSSVSGGKSFSLLEGDDTTLSMGDSMRDITDFEDFKNCLSAARAAIGCVHPWTKSVEAIEGFMRNSSYCAQELSGRSNRAALLTGFVNYIFGRNAFAWKSKGMFLTADELRPVWKAWFAKQSSSIIDRPQQVKEQVQKKGQSMEKNDLCRRYNSKAGCARKEEDCKTFFGLKLRHRCNVRLPTGKFCELAHPRHQH